MADIITITKEKLTTCAIKRDGVIHVGTRSGHWEIRERLGDSDPMKHRHGDEEGFVTNDSLRFVDREEAREIGLESGQLGSMWRDGARKLLSSDIDW